MRIGDRACKLGGVLKIDSGEMFSGFQIGAVVAPIVSLLLIGHVGFRGLFAVGGLPLVTLLPLALWLLPKASSAPALTLRAVPLPTPGGPCRSVLKGRAATSTVLFAAANSFALLLSFALITWLPQLMRDAGYSLGSALEFLLILNLGSLTGGLVGGWAADHVGGRRVVLAMYTISALSLASLVLPGAATVIKLLVFVTGAVACGNQSVLFGFMGSHYPARARATAVGIISGLACLGAAAGPLLGGLLVKGGATLNQNVLVFAGVAVLAGICILLIPKALEEVPDGELERV